MKALILFDSVYGNTEQIARAIAAAIDQPAAIEQPTAMEPQDDVRVVKVGEANPGQFAGLDVCIVGAPTQRFRTTPAVSDLLKSLPKNSLKGVKVAAFDTRLSLDEIRKTPVLAFFVKLFGKNAYAATLIANRLKQKGGALAGSPQGFLVAGMEGPLLDGELDRAAQWARTIMDA